MRILKKVLIGCGFLGFLMTAVSAGASDCGAGEKMWMSALLMVLSRALYSYLNWMQAERAKKSIRYRRYLEKENEMSA